MKDSIARSLNISRLGIGTVQFGMDYGIANSRGKVPFREILRILDAAREAGINLLDTSRAYGSSEEELGRAIAELGAEQDFIVCTKLDLPAGYRELPAPDAVAAAQRSLAESRRALRRESLDFYLLHDPEYRHSGSGAVWELLLEERANGGIRHLGVSIARGPQEARAMIDDPDVEAVQIPFNLFDWRWHASSTFEHAEREGVVIFTRSAFLQGLLVMDPEEVGRRLPRAKAFRERFEECVARSACSPRELALRYVLSTPGIASTVVGVDGFDQFAQNIALARAEPLDEELMSGLRTAFGDVPESVVNPALW